MLCMTEKNRFVARGNPMISLFRDSRGTENTEDGAAAAGHAGSLGAFVQESGASTGNFRTKLFRYGLKHIADRITQEIQVTGLKGQQGFISIRTVRRNGIMPEAEYLTGAEAGAGLNDDQPVTVKAFMVFHILTDTPRPGKAAPNEERIATGAGVGLPM